MRLLIEGHGTLTIHDADFLAEGGEGRVYASGRWVVKLYHDPARVIAKGKIGELRRIGWPRVVTPVGLVHDENGQALGYVMRRLERVMPVARLFANAFWQREGMTYPMALGLLNGMAENIRMIHRAGCLLVDGHELNTLVEEGFTEAYVIDTDSFETPSYPATAVMATIRDPLASRFSAGSDWFSFAVIACQLLTGIHPYKGSHPDYAKGDLEGRMRDGVSIFDARTRVPAATRDRKLIPSLWRDWLVKVLQYGERAPPPEGKDAVLLAKPVGAVKPLEALRVRFELLFRVDEGIVDHRMQAGREITVTAGWFRVGREAYPRPAPDAEVMILPMAGAPVAAWIHGGRLRLKRLDVEGEIPVALNAEGMVRNDNTLFIFREGKAMEVELVEGGGRVFAGVKQRWSLLANATRLWEGFFLTDALGMPTALLPMRPGAAAVVPLPELRGCEVLEARLVRNVLYAVGMQRGSKSLTRLLFRFTADFSGYGLERESGIEQAEIGLAVMDTGVMARFVEDGVWELSFSDGNRGDKQRIGDPALTGVVRPMAVGGELRCIRGEEVYRLRQVA